MTIAASDIVTVRFIYEISSRYFVALEILDGDGEWVDELSPSGAYDTFDPTHPIAQAVLAKYLLNAPTVPMEIVYAGQSDSEFFETRDKYVAAAQAGTTGDRRTPYQWMMDRNYFLQTKFPGQNTDNPIAAPVQSATIIAHLRTMDINPAEPPPEMLWGDHGIDPLTQGNHRLNPIELTGSGEHWIWIANAYRLHDGTWTQTAWTRIFVGNAIEYSQTFDGTDPHFIPTMADRFQEFRLADGSLSGWIPYGTVNPLEWADIWNQSIAEDHQGVSFNITPFDKDSHNNYRFLYTKRESWTNFQNIKWGGAAAFPKELLSPFPITSETSPPSGSQANTLYEGKTIRLICQAGGAYHASLESVYVPAVGIANNTQVYSITFFSSTLNPNIIRSVSIWNVSPEYQVSSLKFQGI